MLLTITARNERVEEIRQACSVLFGGADFQVSTCPADETFATIELNWEEARDLTVIEAVNVIQAVNTVCP